MISIVMNPVIRMKLTNHEGFVLNGVSGSNDEKKHDASISKLQYRDMKLSPSLASSSMMNFNIYTYFYPLHHKEMDEIQGEKGVGFL
mmetsp:Transcript_6631/g.8688  ORF Transcript_6631/g.8688 Transcript_6631/m.8688 type:complete len:87 (-) Transcript_6631:377-637(-)